MIKPPPLHGRVCETAEDCADFLAWLDKLIVANDRVAIDTETAGLEWWQRDHVRLITFARGTEGWAIPIRWWGRVVHEAMHRISTSGLRVVFHNASFDMLSLEADGFPVPEWWCVEDTVMLLALRRSDLPKGLKSYHVQMLLGGWVKDGQNELKGRFKQYGFSVTGSEPWNWVPVDDPMYLRYAIFDTIVTDLLYEELLPTREQFLEQYERKRRVQAIMARREMKGIRVDEQYTHQLMEHLDDIIRRERQYLHDLGIEDPGSRKNTLTRLEQDFGFEPVEFTATGQPALNKNVLKTLAKGEDVSAEVASSLIKYHRAVKWRATYPTAFLEKADINGRVHPSINVMGTRTGRWTASGPNLLNLPGDDPLIRSCLLPNKGEVWVSVDYASQEPRLMAHFGRAPAMIELFQRPDGKIYNLVGPKLFGLTWKEEHYGSTKIFVLSRNYGAGARSISQALGRDINLVKALCEEYDELVGLATINAMVEEATVDRDPPYVVTHGGRRQYADPEHTYKLVNFLMQSSAADMIDDAVIRLVEAGYEETLKFGVYDELNFSLPAAKAEREPMLADIQRLMETDEFAVPMPTEAMPAGKSWGASMKA